MITPISTTTNSLTYTFYDKSKFTFGIEPQPEGTPPTKMTFEVDVPYNSYLAIGFGSTMSNTDMIIWQAQSESASLSEHTYLDLWSESYGKP